MTEETKVPEWMVGSGLEDADMSGDYDPSRNVRRLWIKPGTGVKLIFLTDAATCPIIWEHQICLGGKWQNWATCLKPTGSECPLCNWAEDNKGQFKRYKAAFFTVIDTSEFKDRSGKTRKNEKRLMCAKSKTVDLLKRRHTKLKEEGHSLVHAMIEAYRSAGDKTPSVGDDFQYVKMIDVSAIEDATEFDYMELLAPNEENVRGIIRRLIREKGGSSDSYGASDTTDASGFVEGSEDAVKF